MSKVKRLPPRSKVKAADTWDLSTLFATDDDWDKALKRFTSKLGGYEKFRGKLSASPKTLAACLKFDADLDRLGEQLGVYATLKTTEDQANSVYQRMMGRFHHAAAQAAQNASFIRPELLAISAARMKTLLEAKEIKPYRLMLERLLRYKKHTLGKKEERLLAMQSEMAETARKTFFQLHNSDLKFGVVKDEKGRQIELSNATYGQLMISPRRSVRKTVFHQYYEQFVGRQNTLAALLGGSIQKDVYYARVRGYDSALSQALFADHVPPAVYDNLIASVRRHLPALYRYYDLRRRKMRLRDIHVYDTYVPILSELSTRRSWNEASKMIVSALAPLGDQYCAVLEKGLLGRWCDRYPNQGKRSGAFSGGCYDSEPFILMNYRPEVFEDIFTLAHEAGHSMHTYHSVKHQPYLYYDYVIFVAEVASTFNELLLSKHLLDRAKSDKERAYLINRELDCIRATIHRQTMFAEFEKMSHEAAESGEPLTVEAFQEMYAGLLNDYFGPDFYLDPEMNLECLRIPHFYRAFYVYKYATGLSAAIALSERVLGGGQRELNDYLGFLSGGSSKYPLDLLRDAGVDMEQPHALDTALARFERLVEELDELL